jgi:NAD(P)-dependent dehydrogenase (short-subunit alcohol dehydrogenase family)
MIFSDRLAMVTGAGSGIGRALAEGFCADGATVVGIGRSPATLEDVARACDGRMHFVVGDVAQPTDVARLFAEALRLGGKVDILVNNAAVYPRASFLDSTQEEWTLAIHTNVVGLAHCCRMALPGMLERGFGRIINLGSLAWRGPIPNSSAYTVSKAGVHALTRSIATEIDRSRYPNVLINELLPGIVRTRMSDSGLDPKEVYIHARALAALPPNGPSGETFLQSTPYRENPGLRARARHVLSRLTRALVRGG